MKIAVCETNLLRKFSTIFKIRAQKAASRDHMELLQCSFFRLFMLELQLVYT